MKYFSMFTGVGGFECGIQRAYDTITQRREQGRTQEDLSDHQQEQIRNEQLYFDPYSDARQPKNVSQDQSNHNNSKRWRSPPVCVGMSEIDKYASIVLQQRFPEVRNYGDATKINTDELPDFDLLVGGFPCQAFSIAGQRKGFEDTRGTLFFEIARVLKNKRPTYFVLENVKGLLSHEKGKTFITIISTLKELGYHVEWGLLNSRYFGVPQNRERIFIIGCLAERGRTQIFPLKQTKRTIGTESSERKEQVTCCQTARQYSNWDGNFLKVYDGQNQKIKPDNIVGTLQAEAEMKQTYGFKILEGSTIRRLTPVECERLQGFQDNWTSVPLSKGMMSDSQRYKMMGNAVTINVITAIMTKLFTSLDK